MVTTMKAILALHRTFFAVNIFHGKIIIYNKLLNVPDNDI